MNNLFGYVTNSGAMPTTVMYLFCRALCTILLIALPFIFATIRDPNEEFEKNSAGEQKSSSDHIVYGTGDFRLKKYNEIWNHAQNLLNLNDQRTLYTEMLKLDSLSLAAKHNEVAGKKGSEQDVKNADKKFVKLLQSFKLNQLAENLKKMLDLNDNKPTFNDRERALSDFDETIISQDENLIKLWNEAKSSGFNDEELTDLQQEFFHYAQKQQNYKSRMSNHIDDAQNSVLVDFEGNDGKMASSNSNIKLRQENKALNEQFGKLIDKVENEKRRSANGQLKNEKAKLLWEKAIKSGSFNDVQLDDLLFELKHFDERLEKLKFVEDDLVNTKFKLNKMGKTDHGKWDEHAILERKLKDYEKRAQKLEIYLMDKVEL